jgi:hypothetical protein
MHQSSHMKRWWDFSKPPLVSSPAQLHKDSCLMLSHHTALKQLVCPLCLIHGWAGLTMDPAIYSSIKITPLSVPPDPGKVLTYLQFGTTQMLKTAKHGRNYNCHTSSLVGLVSECLTRAFPIILRCQMNPF